MDPRRPLPNVTGKRPLELDLETETSDSKRVANANLSLFYNELVPRTGTYQYTPIGPNEIRLLHLFPADNKSDLLSSELKVARLDDPLIRYEALSYTWGYEEPIEKIWIQGDMQRARQQSSGSSRPWSGLAPVAKFKAIALYLAKEEREKNKTFYVRPNLSDALRHLRDYSTQSLQQTKRRTQTTVLWIDYICINQNDKEERNAQVKMMAEIYQRADAVFVWLGREGEDSNIAMDFIQRNPYKEHQDMLSVRPSAAPQWRAFMALMRRTWFRRRWVVQELALAKNVYLRCGDVSVNWVNFVVAVEFFLERYDTIAALYNDAALFEEDVKVSAAPKMVTVTNEFVRGSRERRERLKTLEILVSELTMFEAGDPRDTVYAVMALAWDVEAGSERQMRDWRSEAASRPTLKVDYRNNILQVFKDFIAFCVQGSNSLDILCRKWAPDRRFKRLRVADRARYRGKKPPLERIYLPSWIGLLKDAAFDMPAVGPRKRVAGNSLVGVSPSQRYNASAGRDAELLFGEIMKTDNNDDIALDLRRKVPVTSPAVKVTAFETLEGGSDRKSDGTVYVRGFRVGTIQDISHRLYEGFIPHEWLKVGGWRSRSEDSEEGNDIPEELWRTLVANRKSEGDIAPQSYLVGLNWAIEQRNANGDINTTKLIRKDQPELMVKVLKRVQEVVWNRRFFKLHDETNEISYRFGIAPTDAKEGDIVCVLLGCSVPVVLSPVNASRPENGYRLAGEAYLHGVMDGEVFNFKKFKNVRLENLKEACDEFCLV